MITLQVGEYKIDESDEDSEYAPRKITLTDAQFRALGFTSTPKQLGCGKSGCAYALTRAVGNKEKPVDTIIKLTVDERDALTSLMLMRQGTPKWAIPIYAVWRLRPKSGKGSGWKNIFAIASARALPMKKAWQDAFDEYYWFLYDLDEKYPDLDMMQHWDDFIADTHEDLSAIEIREGKSEATERQRSALEMTNEAVVACRNLGLDWQDIHSGNWGVFDGRPVVIDLGMKPRPEIVPAGTVAPTYPKVKEIPILT